MKTELFLEFSCRQVNKSALLETAKEIWKNDGNKVKDLHTVELYYKPEENKCYYVFNGEGSSDSYFGV